MRLLVTRPEPDASRLADDLRKLGHEPFLQPLLTLEALPFHSDPLHKADALIFSSQNALRVLQDGNHLSGLLHLPICCVGAETAKMAQQLGFPEPSAVAETGSQLADMLINFRNRYRLMLHVTGEHQAFDFSEVYARYNLPFHTLNVYTMKCRQEFDSWLLTAFEKELIEGVLLLSPRTAEVFVDLSRKHCLTDFAENIRYYCLSDAVASKLCSLRTKAVFVAGKPSLQALLALVGNGLQMPQFPATA